MFALIDQLATCLKALSAPQRGQTNVELGAVLVFASIVAVAMLRNFGGSVVTMLAPLTGTFWGA